MFDCRDVLRELSNYLDDDTAAEARRHIEEHLRDCRTCRVLVDTTRKTVRLVCDSDVFELPAPLSTNIMERIRRLQTTRPQTG